MDTFDRDLRRGLKVETLVLNRIKLKYPKAIQSEGYRKEWDIYVPETKTKVEVKADWKWRETGNLVIETSMSGRPSALSTTTADFWVFFLEDRLIWITPTGVRRAISDSGARLREFVGSGDYNSKTAYLIPVCYIEDNASLIEKI